MNKKFKVWLIIATCLVLVGCIIFVGVMTSLKWDFSELSVGKYETNNYEINDSFTKIKLTTHTADVEILPSEDGECKIICYEEKKVKHAVRVEDDTLIIEAQDNRKWYDYINVFSFSSPKITIYLPTGMLGSLDIKGSTGNITISDAFTFENISITASTSDVSCYASATGEIKIELSTGNIYLSHISAQGLDLSTSTGKISADSVVCAGDVTASVSTGKARLDNVTCRNLYSVGKTGDIELKDVVATGKFSIERSTGDVEFKKCDAGEIHAKTSTGDIEGSLLSDKIFIAHTSTGDVDVPRSTTGGKCELTTSTGDIDIKVKEKD